MKSPTYTMRDGYVFVDPTGAGTVISAVIRREGIPVRWISRAQAESLLGEKLSNARFLPKKERLNAGLREPLGSLDAEVQMEANQCAQVNRQRETMELVNQSKPEASNQSETAQSKQLGCKASRWVSFVCWLGSCVTGVSILANAKHIDRHE